MTRIRPNLTAPQKAEPNDFKLVKPDEFIANKNHNKKDPASLLLTPFQRFPIQPEYPSHAAEFARDARLEAVKKDRSRLLLTDRVFPQLWLQYARDQDQIKRIASRKLIIQEDEQRHAEHMKDLQTRSRAFFFKTVYDIVKKRESTHVKLRLLQRATFEQLHAERAEYGRKELEETHKLIAEGFKRHAAFLAWRLDNMFLVMGNHSIVKVHGNGFALEHEIGKLCGDLRALATNKHHTWRLDNLYMTLPNGSIAHIHHAGGQQKERVEAEIHAPIAHKRTHDFKVWRDGITTVTTPNGGMIEAHHQGHMPEATAAMLEMPKLDARALKNLQWHRSHLLVSQPNGGFRPASNHNFGAIPEAVTGDIAWRHKRHISCKNWDWRLSNLAVLTGNGAIAHQKSHFGHTMERISAQAEFPHKQQVIDGFEQWHRDHMYGPTPNNGIAPLKNHGHSIEAVAAAASDRPRQTAKSRTDLWHATHKYKETANHGWAPLKNVGQSIEHIGASITGELKAKEELETLEKHLGDLYTPTSNHGWRRVGRNGKIVEHIASQVARPSEGSAAIENLPAAGGHALAAAELSAHHVQGLRDDAKRAALRRNLANQYKTESLLAAHVHAPHGHTAAETPDVAEIKPKRLPEA